MEKPPLGLKPRYVHDDQRITEILEAMNRYVTSNQRMKIPHEWTKELGDLLMNRDVKEEQKEEKVNILGVRCQTCKHADLDVEGDRKFSWCGCKLMKTTDGDRGGNTLAYAQGVGRTGGRVRVNKDFGCIQYEEEQGVKVEEFHNCVVKFGKSPKMYYYKTLDDDIEQGEYVLVQTVNGPTCAMFVRYLDTESVVDERSISKATKWLISSVQCLIDDLPVRLKNL